MKLADRNLPLLVKECLVNGVHTFETYDRRQKYCCPSHQSIAELRRYRDRRRLAKGKWAIYSKLAVEGTKKSTPIVGQGKIMLKLPEPVEYIPTVETCPYCGARTTYGNCRCF